MDVVREEMDALEKNQKLEVVYKPNRKNLVDYHLEVESQQLL